MRDIQPIKDYVAAIDALHHGQSQKASELLAQAMGTDKPTPIIKGAIKQLLTSDTPANDVALSLVAHRSNKKGES